MTAGAKKEFRVLLLPWCVAMLAAFSSPALTTLGFRMQYHRLGGPFREGDVLAVVCILVAGLAMAAMPFGHEFHHRTFGLVLVQPIKRSRIWWSKTGPLIVAYMSIGVAFVAGRFLTAAVWGTFKSWDGNILLWIGIVLAGVMCSSAFWTLLSRSIIGGMALPLATQVLLAGIITWIVSGTSAVPPEEFESRLFPALGTGAFVYCILFLYLGWRKFSRLQWREGYVGESFAAARPALRTKESRPASTRGSFASLLRKELRLNRPVFLLAALFVVCWLAALGLEALVPALKVHIKGLFVWMMVIYLPLAWLLSGCISLGEEKQLGTWGWHLTLPVSGARQWTVKISFALLMTLILGFLVPAAAWLAAGTPYIAMPSLWRLNFAPYWLALLAAVFGTVLSFWSVTLFGSVVRAVLFSFLGAGILLFGSTLVSTIGHVTQFWGAFCGWIIIEFQISPYAFISDGIFVAGWIIGLSLLLVLLLRQSYVHCRREPSRRILVRCSLILAISLFLPLWLGSSITYSLWHEVESLEDNLGKAIAKLPPSVKKDLLEIPRPGAYGDALKTARPVSIEEMDGMSSLSPETRRWLRGSTLRFIGPLTAANFAKTRFDVNVHVTLPDGREFITFAPW